MGRFVSGLAPALVEIGRRQPLERGSEIQRLFVREMFIARRVTLI